MVAGTVSALLLGLSLAGGSLATGNITEDSYFYGESPPVYPSPQGTGAGEWAGAYAKAKAFVAQLTDDEKVNLTAGTWSQNGCSGTITAISRLGFPGLCVNDAENGLRGTDYVNGWASGVHTAATWNRSLAHGRGVHMGREFYTKGVNVILGPVVGPLGRMVRDGRNWEGFAADPYLTGQMVYETVDGLQSSGVATSLKHMIGYEQETNRSPETNSEGQEVQSVSSNIDDETMHMLYLWPFADAVRAGTASVMCSYNRINNSYASQNSKVLNGLLKTELGFQGYVMTDWGAQHTGIASANAGLDMAMPQSSFWGKNLTTAIANGSMEASRLDDMAIRIMATWYLVGQDEGFPTPGIGMAEDLYAPHQRVIATKPDEKSTLLAAAIEGQVLVKNVNNALPLKSPHMLSIFGYDARTPETMDIPSESTAADNPLIINRTLTVGGGSGTNSPAYIDSPLSAIQRQAYEDGTSVLWDTVSKSPEIDPTSDACLVFINAYAGEGYDRRGLYDDYSDELVANVADQCANTIVVVHNAGIRLVDPWIDHENVTAVIIAHLPGQDSGRALVDVLYGRANPSGKLPYTIAHNETDYGNLLNPALPEGIFWLFPQANFTEGQLIDYRAFDAYNITPRFEFGYGLSYTTFDYSSLTIKQSSSSNSSTSSYPPAATTEPGGNPHLWDELLTVSAVVSNTGDVGGAEVAQLYLGIPNAPVRQLRGFEKFYLAAGESVEIDFHVTRRDLSIWDVYAQDWLLQEGPFVVSVGRSSRDLPLQGTFTF
ncbi:hypothetical protein ASPZODRAFT_76651 [Penicilliopsis zonata CBS 506.65]|uniref:Probable beta-glucosidase M n=1 Tax=Penicilliopsis zonata CBS 506.65 TaxID=1073090 RepID=A0A1L9S5V1_9EURO|nr:hypothetical protein ASPZODRAFT_76651 [Penicilliopsis zonata CBS 506.65]OJJ42548.1 hypothetical protein ASPZODRAFT_76651 [Penicilliopsis zonata CBS 506.65]